MSTRVVMVLYLATVASAFLVAYDRGAALGQAVLLAGGALAALAIAEAGRRWGARALGPAGAACALLAGAAAAYFLLRYEWDGAAAGKFAAVHQAGLWIQAHRPTLPLSEDINGNVAGGALAVLLPPAAAGAEWAWRRWAPVGAALALAVALALLALLLTSSRGAWIGLAAGVLTAVLLASAASRAARGWAPAVTLLGFVGLAGSLLVLWAAAAWPGFERLLGGVASAAQSALSRAQLWRDGLALAGDYPFTGAGFASTMMVYSSYAMLLHVGFIPHAHNLLLQIVLYQGLPGLLAFMGLLALGWRAIALHLPPAGPARNESLPWRLAAAASLTALVVHGAVDAGLYTSRLAPALFLPMGIALGCRTVAPSAAHRRWASIAPAAVLVALLGLALLPVVRAAAQANLGALSQTQAELSVYRWPDWPIQDALRRPLPGGLPAVDLEPAVARYRAGLALDPGNVAANRRLGQIELSLGDYGAARAHLEAAYAAAGWQRPVRQLLAEVYAVTGEPGRSAELLAGVDLSQDQLSLREWWYRAVDVAVDWGR